MRHAYTLTPVEGDPDVLILRLSHNSSPQEEAEAYAEARGLLGASPAQLYLDAEEEYDVFELTVCVDYERPSDFARK